jgi:hypothetical protein
VKFHPTQEGQKMYPLTRDPIDGFAAAFADGSVVLDSGSYPTGRFAVDAMRLTEKELRTIRESTFQHHRRISACLEERRRKELLTALDGVRTLAKLIPVYRELGDRAFLRGGISGSELDALFQQGAYREGAEQWLAHLSELPRVLEQFQRCAVSYADEYLSHLTERTPSAYASAWQGFQMRLLLEDDVAYGEATEYEGEEFLRYRERYQDEVRRRYLQTSFDIGVSYKTIPHPKRAGESVLAEEVFYEELETFLTLDLIRGFMAGHTPRRCDHCGRFFLLDSGYDIRYCENEALDVPGKTCSQVGAHSKERRRSKEDPIIGEYKRVYNRLKTRKNRGQLSPDAWNRQVAEIQELKEKAQRGEIALTELKRQLSMY